MTELEAVGREIAQRNNIKSDEECPQFGKAWDGSEKDCQNCQLDCEEYALACKEYSIKKKIAMAPPIKKKGEKKMEEKVEKEAPIEVVETTTTSEDIRDKYVGKKVKYSGKKGKHTDSTALVLRKLSGNTGLLLQVDGQKETFTASYKKLELI